MTERRAWISPVVTQCLRGPLQGKRILCLVDGEHYPPVVGRTVQDIENHGGRVVGLLFVGGTEKVESATEELTEAVPGARVYLHDQWSRDGREPLRAVIRDCNAEAVIDLSGEPILDYAARFRFASLALAEDVAYLGADFVFTPPPRERLLSRPSLGLIGTGKRVGKTAIGVLIARLLDREGFDPVMVCMGRGGPPEPHYVNPREMRLDASTLLSVAGRGGHAASDYWEEALLSRVPTIGCRRCGGGMGGSPVGTNAVEGARMAEGTSHSFVVMEGSGATFAPVRTDRRIVVAGAGQPPENVLGYLGEYRLLTSHLAIVTMCEEPVASAEKVEVLRDGIRHINPDLEVALTVFRPEPLGEVSGRSVFLATTAPEPSARMMVHALEQEHGCDVRGFTSRLADRSALREELRAGLEDCELLLTEIKAASIDVAARAASDRRKDIVFLHNRAVLVGGTVENLDEAVLRLCREARRSCT